MIKKLTTLMVTAGILLAPMQGFAETFNYISNVSKVKTDKVHMSQIIINNEHREVSAGEYITITLENAQFDTDSNKKVRIRSGGIDFDSGSKRRVTGQVTERGAESDEISITFHSEVLGGKAIVTIDGEGSGITSGEYVFATTEDDVTGIMGKVKNKFPVYFSGTFEAPTIVIEEQTPGTFRYAESDNGDYEPLLTLKIASDGYEFRNMGGYDAFEIEVDDGKDNSRRYKVGESEEFKLDNSLTKLTFKKDDDRIFEGGERYTLELKNIQIAPTKDHVAGSDIVVEFGGLLMDKEKITLASETAEDVVMEASKAQLKAGTKQTIKFKIEEGIPNTLFKEGYINLGVYGGAVIDSASSLKFKIKEGNETITQEDKKAFKIEADPIGDRITISNYRRKDKNALLKLEGTLEVTTPEDITNDIEFFINEPSLSKASIKIVLEGTDKPELPEEPKEPEIEEEIVESKGPKVKFQVDSQSYFVGETSFLLDMKPYISPHSRIMVPFRYVAYALGVHIDDLKWDGPSKMISLKGEKSMTIDAQTGRMVIDGETSTLSEIKMINGRTFVPVGEIGRAFGVKVDWDEETRTATFN